MSGLNDVGPQTVKFRLDRSDQLSRPVRPVPPNLTGEVPACALPSEFELMTLFNLITEDKGLGVTVLPPKRNLVPRFNEGVKWRVKNWKYLDRFVAIPDI